MKVSINTWSRNKEEDLWLKFTTSTKWALLKQRIFIIDSIRSKLFFLIRWSSRVSQKCTSLTSKRKLKNRKKTQTRFLIMNYKTSSQKQSNAKTHLIFNKFLKNCQKSFVSITKTTVMPKTMKFIEHNYLSLTKKSRNNCQVKKVHKPKC